MRGTLHDDQYTFMITSRRFLHRMRNVSGKYVQKNKTHLLSSITFPDNHSIYKKVWKNLVDPGWPQMTVYSAHTLFMLDN